jgi:hypothetical protein
MDRNVGLGDAGYPSGREHQETAVSVLRSDSSGTTDERGKRTRDDSDRDNATDWATQLERVRRLVREGAPTAEVLAELDELEQVARAETDAERYRREVTETA